MEENETQATSIPITVKTPTGGYPEAEAVLMRLGCDIKKYSDYQHVIFPAGTQRKELPRIKLERYEITLPEGIVLYQYALIRNPELFTLTIPDSFLPDSATLPTFKQIRITKGITLEDLIKQSRLSEKVVQRIDSRGMGQRADIDRLLDALSDLSGKQYSRWNVGGFTII